MRQRSQRFEIALETSRLLVAKGAGCLIARTRQIAQQGPAAAANKSQRPTYSRAISKAVDSAIARRGTMPHLTINARRKDRGRLKASGTSTQSDNFRKRSHRIVEIAPPYERTKVEHAPAPVHFPGYLQPRELVHQVQLEEVRRCDRFEHTVVGRLELPNQLSLHQGRIER